MSAFHTSEPEFAGSVAGAPYLPEAFARTFTSRFIDTAELRLHAVIGGDGPPLLLVHGWPETWYAWRHVMPALARDFEVVAVDQRGMGLSDKPARGHDSYTQARDLVGLMDARGHDRFALIGHDTGAAISYALAAQHGERVARLALLEIPGAPGTVYAPPLFVPAALADEVVEYYVQILSNPDSLRGSFGWYRAIGATIAQDQEHKDTPLTMPVLGVGGGRSFGDHVGEAVRAVAPDARSVVIRDAGHFLAEESPDELRAVLRPFLAPYRDAWATASAVTFG